MNRHRMLETFFVDRPTTSGSVSCTYVLKSSHTKSTVGGLGLGEGIFDFLLVRLRP
jgi:hypothetical protein